MHTITRKCYHNNLNMSFVIMPSIQALLHEIIQCIGNCIEKLIPDHYFLEGFFKLFWT